MSGIVGHYQSLNLHHWSNVCNNFYMLTILVTLYPHSCILAPGPPLHILCLGGRFSVACGLLGGSCVVVV